MRRLCRRGFPEVCDGRKVAETPRDSKFADVGRMAGFMKFEMPEIFSFAAFSVSLQSDLRIMN
jgi:hypothetical protein